MFGTYSLAKARQAELVRKAGASLPENGLAQQSWNRFRNGLTALYTRMRLLREATMKAQNQRPTQRLAGDIKII